MPIHTPEPPPHVLTDRRSRVLMILDVVESVRLMEENEDAFVRRWQALVDKIERHLLGQTPPAGKIVKSLGDGLMLEFIHARHCLDMAFQAHDFAAALNQDAPSGQHLMLRVGAHVAEFVEGRHDIYGAGVNLVARVATLAGPGEIVVTATLRDHLTDGLDADVEDLGECHLKHVRRPVRAYRLRRAGQCRTVRPLQNVLTDLRPTVVVIPFATQGGAPEQDLLGDAVAGEIIAGLSRTPLLNVISRLSANAFRARSADVAEIRSHLGAQYVLTGTCRCGGPRFALYLELVNCRSGHVLWADNLKGEVAGLFGGGEALIEQVVSAVGRAIVSSELECARHQSLPTLEAHTLLLSAVSLMHRFSRSHFDRAREMLEHLIERTQRHPLPRAYLAHWWVLRASQGWSEDPKGDSHAAIDCTRRALDCDPEHSLALTIDGLVHMNLLRDPAAAQARYDAAINSNPNESLAWLLRGTMHAFKGEGEQAVADTRRALQLSPLDPLKYYYDSLAASASLSAGHWADAIELAGRSARANRTHTSTYRVLAIAQAMAGDGAAARVTAQQLMSLDPEFTVTRFMQRSPGKQYAIAQTFAEALHSAGVPM